jgi:adenylate cyclase
MILGTGVGLLGIVLSTVPAVLRLDESVGLAWLFAERGREAPPDDVVVVNIAADSAAKLGLTSQVDRWPRALHARLIRRLAAAGARVVAFDIMFDMPREPEGDHALEEAVASAGNTILLERVQSEVVNLAEEGGSGSAVLERRVPPIEPLKRAALATAPFTLPVVPIRVSQFWTFGRAVGDTGSLPVVVLQAYARPVLAEFLAMLDAVRPGRAPVWLALGPKDGKVVEGGGLEGLVRNLRGLFRANPGLGDAMRGELGKRHLSAAQKRLLRALIGVYAGAESRYLSYYGPARTIRTVPYHDALQDLSPEQMKRVFGGKAVFVGFSESKQPEQQDWFYSVFSQNSGQNLSGVEIGATAFANLLDGLAVEPMSLPARWLSVFAWGFVIASIGVQLSGLGALAAAMVAAVLYAGAAELFFARLGLWSPLAVPLLMQLPAALFAGLLWNHRTVKRQRERIQAALGYYLPKRALDRLAHQTAGTKASKELVYGTCLVTDAEHYTSLSESLEPEELSRLMDEYYRVLLDAVSARGAIVSDLAGDSMVAVWVAAQRGDATAAAACAAAQAVREAVEGFNLQRGRQVLPTRIGLDSGPLVLGNVGSDVRGEYRAVGDIVNTAARLQGLNRHLGTRILMTEATFAAQGLDGFATRSVGRFLLVGKKTPVSVFELQGPSAEAARADTGPNGLFAEALKEFQLGRWGDAAREFTEILQEFACDGPSRFYLDRCRTYLEAPPAGVWDGVVRMTVK